MKLLASFLAVCVNGEINITTRLCGQRKDNGVELAMDDAQSKGDMSVLFNYDGDIDELTPKEIKKLVKEQGKVITNDIATQTVHTDQTEPYGTTLTFDEITSVIFSFSAGDILCLEKLEISDPENPSKVRRVVQDYDPNGWDVSLPENKQFLTWTPLTDNKQSYWTNRCVRDTRNASQYPPFELACHETVKFGFTPIDECATGTHGCAPGAVCTDTAESFTCACPAGTSGVPYKLAVGESEGCTQISILDELLDLKSYGCLCKAVMNGHKHAAKAYDEVDQACRAWRKCSDCVFANTDNCDSREPYLFSLDDIFGATCQDSSACGTRLCECDRKLYNAVESLGVDLTLGQNIPQKSCPAPPNAGYEGACCQEGNLFRGYNSRTHCCADGHIGQIGEC